MTGGRKDVHDGGVPPSPRHSPTAGSRRQAVTILAVGTLLIVTAAVVWLVARPEPAGQTVSSVGAAGALELTVDPTRLSSGSPANTPVDPTVDPTADPAADTAGTPPLTPSGPPPAAGAAIPPGRDDPESAAGEPISTPRAEAPAAPSPVPAAPPDRVRIPALDVDATVTPVGVAPDGEVEVPGDVSTVGWYRFGPVPGAAGSSVLVGHVDDYRQGVGVLARIGDLEPGDTVEVADAEGAVRSFTVIAREQWSKTEIPLDRLFDRGGEPRLVLLTCGGAFDDSRLGYTDNIAVTAIPSPS